MRLMNLTDDPVFIAINTEGVFVIDMDDVVGHVFCRVFSSCAMCVLTISLNSFTWKSSFLNFDGDISYFFCTL